MTMRLISAKASGSSDAFISQDGTVLRSLQERMISMRRKVLQVEKEIAPESVYDFSFVRATNKEPRKGESS
jgi:predicted transcriptional regulator with HTH domain